MEITSVTIKRPNFLEKQLKIRKYFFHPSKLCRCIGAVVRAAHYGQFGCFCPNIQLESLKIRFDLQNSKMFSLNLSTYKGQEIQNKSSCMSWISILNYLKVELFVGVTGRHKINQIKRTQNQLVRRQSGLIPRAGLLETVQH